MPFYHNQAEGHSYFTGQAAEPHSHNHLPQQAPTPHFPVLNGVGALFPSPPASRMGSQDDTSSHFDNDEAFSPQADMTDATPPVDHTAQLHNSPSRDRPGPHSPLTPRGTPVRDLPYLLPEEIPEFRRQRAARMNPISTLDPYRPALEDTPRQSPVDTNFTSVDAGSEHDSVYHEHTHAPFGGNQTLSNRSIESEYDNESEEHDSMIEQTIQSHYCLPEYTYNTVDAPGHDAMQLVDADGVTL